MVRHARNQEQFLPMLTRIHDVWVGVHKQSDERREDGWNLRSDEEITSVISSSNEANVGTRTQRDFLPYLMRIHDIWLAHRKKSSY